MNELASIFIIFIKIEGKQKRIFWTYW